MNPAIDNREDYGYGWNEIGKRYYDLKPCSRIFRHVDSDSGLKSIPKRDQRQKVKFCSF